jgi:GH15 family glucan-1,4-alpha-glucosidase
VRVGNGAAGQRQLDVYGSFVHTVWLYVSHGQGHRLERDTGKAIAAVANHVCDVWRRADSGIWEVRGAPTRFVQFKAMCWVALDRAVKLAEDGRVPNRHVARRRAQAREIRSFVDEHGWDDERRSYVRATAMHELDASLLTLPLLDWAFTATAATTASTAVLWMSSSRSRTTSDCTRKNSHRRRTRSSGTFRRR